MEFRNRLKSATGLKLPTTAVFDHPTSTGLARYLARALDTDGPPDGWEERRHSGIQPPHWPLTAYQRDIVAVGARYPDLAIVQAFGYARLEGTVNLEWMRECMRRTYLRNDSLRLRIELRDGEFSSSALVPTYPSSHSSILAATRTPRQPADAGSKQASERALPLDWPSNSYRRARRSDRFVLGVRVLPSRRGGRLERQSRDEPAVQRVRVSGVDARTATTTSRCPAIWTSSAPSVNTAARRNGRPIASTSSRNTATLNLRCSPAVVSA